EIAAIADAAGDWKAPLARRQRKLRRGKDVPHDERTAEVRILGVARVVGKSQFAAGEGADLLHAREPLPEIGVRGLADDFLNRFRAREDVELPRRALPVVVGRFHGAAAGKYQGK